MERRLMERLLMLHLQAGACSAEVLLNGMPIAYVGPEGGHACLPVHEYTLTGKNRLELVAGRRVPGQARAVAAAGRAGADLGPARVSCSRARAKRRRPRRAGAGIGRMAGAPRARATTRPATQTKDVDLPVNFPRWRWLDAPPIGINAAVQRQVLEFLQQLALDLGRGDPESLLAAAKLRFDELAVAYQRTTTEGVQRFRDHLQQLYAAKALKLIPPRPRNWCCGRCSMAGSSIASPRPAARHCVRRMRRRWATMRGRCGWPWWRARSMYCVEGRTP
jgi:hypothetical protein